MGLIMKNGIQYPGVGSGEGSGLEISQLDDVKITTPLADKESLVYNKEIGKWENKKISNESSLPYNLIVSEKWDNNISGGASENTVWTSKIFLTKGTYSIYDYVSWNSSKRIWYRYYFREMSDDFEGYFHGSQDHSQTNVTTDSQGWATFTTNEQFTITKGTAKIQLVFWGDAGQANSGGGLVSLYKIDGLNNSSGITELPIASTETLGGIKVGENLSIAEDGTLNAEASGGSSQIVYGGIDTSNVIYELTSSVEGTEWVATEDCYFIGEFVSTGGAAYLLIDGVQVSYNYVTTTSSVCFPIFILKGQTIKYFGNDVHVRTAKIYGVKKSENILHEYSTEEKVVGTWIDGKPIYEKTIIIQQYSTLNFNENVVKICDNYGKLIACHGTCIDGNGYEILLGPNWSDYNIGIQIRNGYICFYNKYGTVDINVTVQYTKTTD